MSVRAELTEAIDAVLTCRGGDAERAADAVLAYLGKLDGSVDPELIAWHLRNDRAEIARLRAGGADVTRSIN